MPGRRENSGQFKRAAALYAYLGAAVKSKDAFSVEGVSKMGRSQRPRPKRLALKLREVRDFLGISQAEMCKLLGFKRIHPAHISGYERGEREPPLPVLLKYARLAGISTDVLIDDKLNLPK
jgi:DNA-binding XRE family transcriptional regulator